MNNRAPFMYANNNLHLRGGQPQPYFSNHHTQSPFQYQQQSFHNIPGASVTGNPYPASNLYHPIRNFEYQSGTLSDPELRSQTDDIVGDIPFMETDSTMNLLDQRFLDFQSFSIVQIFQTLFAYFFVFSTSKLFKSAIKPFRRGFFCDDQSISYPYRQSTVSAALVYLVGYTSNLVLILTVEWLVVFVYWKAPRGSRCVRGLLYKSSFFFYSLVASSLPFMFGGIMSMSITDVGKFTVGRLRPHFISVCQPNWNYVNCSSGYVINDVCTGDPTTIRDGRLSFPSGHSSLAFYVSTFMVLYLHKRASPVIRPARLIIPIINLIALILALFTALSRISDNKHHPTDVLAGSLIGIGSACYANYLLPQFRQLDKLDSTSVETETDNEED